MLIYAQEFVFHKLSTCHFRSVPLTIHTTQRQADSCSTTKLVNTEEALNNFMVAEYWQIDSHWPMFCLWFYLPILPLPLIHSIGAYVYNFVLA